jgi:hypothetical protein
MTQDEIIAMLRAACDKDKVDPEQNGFWIIHTEELEAFAKLVAQHERDNLIDAAMKAAEKGIDTAIALEREACAKVCESMNNYMDDGEECATAIRARGQA